MIFGYLFYDFIHLVFKWCHLQFDFHQNVWKQLKCLQKKVEISLDLVIASIIAFICLFTHHVFIFIWSTFFCLCLHVYFSRMFLYLFFKFSLSIKGRKIIVFDFTITTPLLFISGVILSIYYYPSTYPKSFLDFYLFLMIGLIRWFNSKISW